MADPLTAAAVSALIEPDLPDPFPLALRLIVPPLEQELLSRGGPAFLLWLVAEVIDGRHRDSKIVFDAASRRYGVANETNVFLGFQGSLQQTLDALPGLP